MSVLHWFDCAHHGDLTDKIRGVRTPALISPDGTITSSPHFTAVVVTGVSKGIESIAFHSSLMVLYNNTSWLKPG